MKLWFYSNVVILWKMYNINYKYYFYFQGLYCKSNEATKATEQEKIVPRTFRILGVISSCTKLYLMMETSTRTLTIQSKIDTYKNTFNSILAQILKKTLFRPLKVFHKIDRP